MGHINTISIEKYIYFESIDSTNTYLSNYLSKNNPQDNICVYTYNQTNGKGQIGRNWFNDEGKNLALSYAFHFQNLDVQHQFYLNMAISLGLHQFVSSIINNGRVSIKWPNDIYINDKKVAGILIQNQLKGRLIGSSIIGIGLNINQESFPQNLPNPISLKQHTQKTYNKAELVQRLEKNILSFLNILSINSKAIFTDYIKHLYRINEKHSFINTHSNESFYGIIKGVSAEGKLLVDISGELEAFNFRTIKFVINNINY
ncbi:MAG: biotin--[acetyl-CoA-carboxylase] ligase [Saprospiraceae bacterium]|nr:biotin--[acetyl-CoA-carboxylase] ligase [Bacteroidia bacterium]NNE13456.1 biotin--[acetyl-CoA-carboxylase] ligase [Saprospiraceae bacterium]NNL93831.1 biotin--[acetyl-CoA-carboxylase] ligase [Saprospiraceae bacterium]